MAPGALAPAMLLVGVLKKANYIIHMLLSDEISVRLEFRVSFVLLEFLLKSRKANFSMKSRGMTNVEIEIKRFAEHTFAQSYL